MSTQMSGVRIGNELLTFIGADEKIKPLRDQIFVAPLDWKPSKVVDVAYGGKPLWGIVRAIGPGTYPIIYDFPKGPKRSKSWLSKHFLPTQVQVGDVIELGGLELGGYLFPTIVWGDETVMIIQEADVCMVHLNMVPG